MYVNAEKCTRLMQTNQGYFSERNQHKQEMLIYIANWTNRHTWILCRLHIYTYICNYHICLKTSQMCTQQNIQVLLLSGRHIWATEKRGKCSISHFVPFSFSMRAHTVSETTNKFCTVIKLRGRKICTWSTRTLTRDLFEVANLLVLSCFIPLTHIKNKHTRHL